MRAFLVCVVLALGGCAPSDAPVWCGVFCDTVGRQAARCNGSNASAAASQCGRTLDCPTIRGVRSISTLQECLREIDGACSSVLPDPCLGQFQR